MTVTTRIRICLCTDKNYLPDLPVVTKATGFFCANCQTISSDMSMLRERFGRNLARLRHYQHMTQDELAEASGLSVGFIRSVEQGVYAPSFDSLELLARALNVTIKDLFDFDQEHVGRNDDV